ncbi:ABC transporter permease [Acetobacterium sp.]|uniref:ABC transporter permease n=1 Tax=Acetobacterium sp. TaxID=1872094 RepID=UPI002F3EF52F
MLNLIRADLFKLFKSMSIKILFGITCLCAFTLTVMAYLIPRGGIDAGMTGIGFMFSDINIISILGAVLAGTFICGDFDNKTIHDAIASGSSRMAVIVSKAIVFFCGIAFLLLPYALATVFALGSGFEFGMDAVALGFLNFLTRGSGNAIQVSELLKLFAVILTLVIVYTSQLSVCVPLAFVLKKPVLVVAIYYAMTILSAQLIALSASSEALDFILSKTPFGGDYIFLTMNSGTVDIVAAIFGSLVFMMVMLAITYGAFRKAEIK